MKTILIFLIFGFPAIIPVQAGARSPEVESILTRFQGLPDRPEARLLCGQQAGHGGHVGWGMKEWVAGIAQETGKWPAIAETGPAEKETKPLDLARFLSVIKERYPRFVYCQFWDRKFSMVKNRTLRSLSMTHGC